MVRRGKHTLKMATKSGMKSVPVVAAPSLLFHTRAEFAAALHVSVRTVDRMIRAGEIVVRRLHGRLVRIPCSEAERLLNGRAKGGQAICPIKAES